MGGQDPEYITQALTHAPPSGYSGFSPCHRECASPIQIVTTFDSLREENAEMKTRMTALKRAQEALQVNAHMHNMHVDLKEGGGRGRGRFAGVEERGGQI